MRLDVGALVDYVHDVRRGSRAGREPAAEARAPLVDADRVRWRRLAVTHAAARLPAGRHADAAHGGLQDSVPRAALLALHARMAGVDPGAWEHPDLAQVWLRWADHVVPRTDVAVFTLGPRPRDPRYREAVDALGELVVAATAPGGGRRDSRSVMRDLPHLPNPTLVRAASASGRIHIRWDARTTEILVADRPPLTEVGEDGEDHGGADRADVEGLRVELARRFVHWHGPAGPRHLARWAGVTRDDAVKTWDLLRPELAPVSFEGRARWMLASDLDALLGAARPAGVRFLPAGDPCLSIGADQQPSLEPRAPDRASGVTTRLVNSLTGRIVVDGTVVGAWGRTQRTLTIDPWALPPDRADEVTAEAESMAGPMGGPMAVRWLARPAAGR